MESKTEQDRLHSAASTGDVKTVKELLQEGTNLDVKDSRGQTPLHLSLQEHHLDVARELIQKGANINIQDNEGFTALHYAS